MALVFFSFFVQPIGGAIATLLTQKYIEISKCHSNEVAGHVYLKYLMLEIVSICIILLIQSFLIKIPFMKGSL